MGIEVGESPIKIVPVKSKRFLCPQCLQFVIEHTPLIRKGQAKRAIELMRKRRQQGQALPQVRLECPNGHSKNPLWTFIDITSPTVRK